MHMSHARYDDEGDVARAAIGARLRPGIGTHVPFTTPMSTGTSIAAASRLTSPGLIINTAQVGIVALPNGGAVLRNG